jgi:cytochrome c biogenesis protein CcmG/thiol:disulfide interchange protein DsbE
MLLAGAAATLGVAGLLPGLLLARGEADLVSESPAVRPVAPELEGDVLVPPPVRLAELLGRPVVVNFWASWCVPCRREAPLLDAAWRRHRSEVVFVGVNVRDLRDDARAFLREFAVPYMSVPDRDDEGYGAYGLTGVPETYYLDASGRIVAHTPGAITSETLEAGIVQALASGTGDGP